MRKTSTRFFTKEEYEALKYKHLDRPTYRKFIQTINERHALQNVVLDKDGFQLPYNLGKLHVIKRYKPKGVIVPYKIGKEYNRHTMGFLYSIVLSRIGQKVVYTSRYDTLVKHSNTREVFHLFYKFNAHRKNIKRKVAFYIKNNLMDYHEQK